MMDALELMPKGVGDLAGMLGENIVLQKIEIPKFYIPNWPDIELKDSLGKVEYRIPWLDDSGCFKWRAGRHKITFKINNTGEIIFRFHGWFCPIFGWYDGQEIRDVYSRSDQRFSESHQGLSRIVALVLFNQFKEEILTQIMAQLRTIVPQHNEVAEAVAKAFEPFVPFLVAEKLAR